jgi:MFS family permease
MKNSFTLVTIYLIAFAGFTSFSWLFPVVPYYASSLGISISDIGIVVSIYSYINAAAILPSGMLSDRWGRRRFLVAGLVVSTVVPFLYPLAKDFWALCIIRALHGLGAAVFVPTAIAAVIDLASPEKRGQILGWYTASAQLGLMAGPIVGGYILQGFGYEAAFYSCGLMPLLGLIFLSARMRSIPQKPPTHPSEDAHSWNWLKQRGAIISLLALIVTAVGSGTISTFMPLYVQGFGITEAGAGTIITACYASSAALRVPSGTLADRFGNMPMIILGLILCAVSLTLVAFSNVLYQLSIIAALFGLGMGFSMPAALSWLAHLSPPTKRGLGMGLGSASFQVGLALGATFMGIVISCSGFDTMYFTAASVSAVGLLIILLLQANGRKGAGEKA